MAKWESKDQTSLKCNITFIIILVIDIIHCDKLNASTSTSFCTLSLASSQTYWYRVIHLFIYCACKFEKLYGTVLLSAILYSYFILHNIYLTSILKSSSILYKMHHYLIECDALTQVIPLSVSYISHHHQYPIIFQTGSHFILNMQGTQIEDDLFLASQRHKASQLWISSHSEPIASG